MDYDKKALDCHQAAHGKLEIAPTVAVENEQDLAIYYTPGVAAPCLAIKDDPSLASVYTGRDNLVAVVTDGSAILGLGNIGSLAGLPVMEGKAVLFKKFAGVNAVPICLSTQNPKEIIDAVKYIAPGFGGINLEDIAAPACFEVEKALKEELSIPVFHDDQHGTAIVTCAAVLNALKLTGRSIEDCKMVINGAGAAGSAIGEMLYELGCRNIIICDSRGIISSNRALSPAKEALLSFSNPDAVDGTLADALSGADVFIGVSAPDCVTGDMVRSMKKDPIIFAMANPRPEILPDLAKEAGAAVVGTGRSDFPNQINNVLVFPGLFRGALDAHAAQITRPMMMAAVKALASVISDEELSADYIIPDVFNPMVAKAIAEAVASAWTA